MALREDINEELQKLKDINFSSLARVEELGRDYNFKEATTTLQKIYEDLDNIAANESLIRLSKSQEDRIFSIAHRVREYADQIQNFVLKGNETNASNQHAEIHKSVRNLLEEDVEFLEPTLERIEFKKLRPNEVQSDIAKATEYKNELERLLKDAKNSKENFDTTIKDIRDSLGAEGADVSGRDFQQQANEHQEAADKWFKGSIVAMLVFVVLISWLFFDSRFNLEKAENNYARIVQIGIFKIVLISIGYLVIYQCIKNYRVNKHLYVLNKHRQLTLSVYKLMTGATSDPEQSHIILGHASKAIFDPNTTGYLDGGDDNPNPINLTEVINKIVDKNTK
jgi:hypothetical protein